MASTTQDSADDTAGASFETTTGPVRIITSASLFDGHDASINVFRRLMQECGAEVIHLGHDRSAWDIANAAIQEDAHAIAITSYQGGHDLYFPYVRQLLDESGYTHVRIFGGGGGTILPHEVESLHANGISKIYTPEDGRKLGLVGMVRDLMTTSSEVDLTHPKRMGKLSGPITASQTGEVALLLTIAETSDEDTFKETMERCRTKNADAKVPIIGLTGTGGAGKSSLIDETMLRITKDNPDAKVALLCTDPTRKRTGGALLGDRLRMNCLSNPNIFMRSFASRGSGNELAACTTRAIDACQAVGFDLIVVETSGIGQGADAVTEICDVSLYVTTNEYGAASQLEKIEMLDAADLIVLNKFEKLGAEDALTAIRKQVRRNRNEFSMDDALLPVVPTIASQFADPGVDDLWNRLSTILNERHSTSFASTAPELGKDGLPKRSATIPSDRTNYLGEISATIRNYHKRTKEIADKVRNVRQLMSSAEYLESRPEDKGKSAADLRKEAEEIKSEIPDSVWELLEQYRNREEEYASGEYTYHVRGNPVKVETTNETLSHNKVPRVALPKIDDDGALLEWLRREGAPGTFPYTGGVFEFRRKDETPMRQFAGEGSAARTNKRFLYLTKDTPYKRLSVAFDSVTLYGRDPDERPDIYGKVGESGVSISCLPAMERLLEGFDLLDKNTSVSMTINGNYAAVLAMFFNAAINQQVAKFEKENGREPNDEERKEIETYTLSNVRGTVQADQIKEALGQNTLIVSLPFAMRLMGDTAQYYIDNDIRNHYSVSISGYHIGEAGAAAVTELALTLANGFHYTEAYRARGMDVNAFVRNFSFFFSNGMDPEYGVMGRVARRIWSIAMRDMYKAGERAQKFKYHIQSSGRSLHAQEFTYNDYRTVLQAQYAIQDAANSLHTNSRDEAFGTPTEDTVRDAQAIQMILNMEYGWNQCENPLQGSYWVEHLTNMVEEQVLQIFEEISRRGGVEGAIETDYQRNRIQQESIEYEHKKHDGSYPIVGVNTFIDEESNDQLSVENFNMEVTRSSPEERDEIIKELREFQDEHKAEAGEAIARLKEVALSGGNIMQELMNSVKVCSLGQITEALFECGGKFRRNM